MIEKIAPNLVAPRVHVSYVDGKGQASERDVIVTEVADNRIIGLDTTKSKWQIRSFRFDRIKSLTVTG